MVYKDVKLILPTGTIGSSMVRVAGLLEMQSSVHNYFANFLATAFNNPDI